jgi:zinc-ribbon family
MLFIIYGTLNRTSLLHRGYFFCPHCQDQREYALNVIKSWFTLFFIPVFPMFEVRRFVKCGECDGSFPEAALRVPLPGGAGPLLAQAGEDLRDGDSIETLQERLVRVGMDPAEAEAELVKMCDGQPKVCQCGQRYHPQRPECPHCGADL